MVIRFALCASGLVIFGLFIHDGFPLVLFSVAGLMVAAGVIGHATNGLDSLAAGFGVENNALALRRMPLLMLGLAIGIWAGVAHRSWLLPAGGLAAFGFFALPAALIGSGEELVYRGFMQGQLRARGRFIAIILPALAHTAYKLALFIREPAGNVDLVYLAEYTLLGGLVLGILRDYSRGVMPCVVAHAIFDIIVYGDCEHAPWWVWN